MPMEIIIPEDELHLEFTKASGKGGQNVNKRSTKVQLHWNIGFSKVIDETQKETIRKVLKERVTQNDEVIITAQEERSQDQNKEIAIEKLHNLLEEILKPQKERIPTKPTKGSVEKRIKEKKETSEKKQYRQKRYTEENY